MRAHTMNVMNSHGLAHYYKRREGVWETVRTLRDLFCCWLFVREGHLKEEETVTHRKYLPNKRNQITFLNVLSFLVCFGFLAVFFFFLIIISKFLASFSICPQVAAISRACSGAHNQKDRPPEKPHPVTFSGNITGWWYLVEKTKTKNYFPQAMLSHETFR